MVTIREALVRVLAQPLPPGQRVSGPVEAREVIALVVMVVLGVVVLGLIVWGWRWWRRAATVGGAEAACGRCGYAVAGLPTFTCPECGSDLREVGIVKAAGRVRASGREPAPTGARTMTIMFTDMVGYTARSATATRGGLLELVSRQRGMVQRVVDRHRGRIVKSLGDGLLIAFDSATDGVLAGVDVQRAIARHNAGAAAGDRFELRIALSTGEVAQADHDVYGDAVNLASRVQGLCPPGAVYFTAATFATVNRAESPCEVVGEFEVKGVEGKVTVYRAVDGQAAVATGAMGAGGDADAARGG